MKIEHLNKLAKARYEECAADVIRHIKALGSECRHSGTDSPLADVWEEFKSQLQGEESIFFDAYEHTIQQFCSQVVDMLIPMEFRLLWFWADGYVEWDEDKEVEPPYMQEDVVQELYQYVRNIAINEDMAHLTGDEDAEDEDDETVDAGEDENNNNNEADEPVTPEYTDTLLFD